MTNKYLKKITAKDAEGSYEFHVDIYDVLQAWQVTNPAIQHAIKKLLQPGQRGHKTRTEDLQEALVSIERAIELEKNNGNS